MHSLGIVKIIVFDNGSSIYKTDRVLATVHTDRITTCIIAFKAFVVLHHFYALELDC